MQSSTRFTLHLAVLTAALCWRSHPTRAQSAPGVPLAGEAPTLGVRLHTPTTLGIDDAAALELNPSALALLPSWSLRLHHSEMRDAGRMAGRGSALFFSSPIGSSGAFGLGAQWLRPTEAIGYAEHLKLSIGYALRLNAWAAVGISYSWFYADKDAALDGLGSWQFGLSLRPSSWLGLGIAVRNFDTPLYDGLPLQREYDLDLALRPLGTRRLELGLGLTIGERRGDVDPRLRLTIEPLRGLQLFGHGEFLRRDYYRDGDERWDFRASAGIRLCFERTRFAASTILGHAISSGRGPLAKSEARSAFQGIALSTSLSGARTAPLIEPKLSLVAWTLSGKLGTPQSLAFHRLVKQIESRSSLAGLVLVLEHVGGGWAKVQELRRWLIRLRQRGKRVYAYLRVGDLRSYYLASAADQILLDPAGGLPITGVASSRLYFKGLFDKLGANPQFIRIAEYKSAPEVLTHPGPTAPARHMQKTIVDELYRQVLADIGRQRKLPPEALAKVLEHGPFVPPMALKERLVDKIVPRQSLKEYVEKDAKSPIISADGALRHTDLWPDRALVAVVTLAGDIVTGKSRSIALLGQRAAGGKTFADTFNALRRNPQVKAVVLRINSPGGSALASDRMWRAARELAKVKPLVVSMADVAASGGYYVAAAAHTVFALPATLTGSIGIFSGKFDLSALFHKLGITSHSYRRGEHADMESPTRPYSPEERAMLQKRLGYFYEQFKAAVAEGRKLSAAEVEKVARGRVFIGTHAQKSRLVTKLGDFADALAEAKRLAKLPLDTEVPLLLLPKAPSGLLHKLLQRLKGGRSDAPDAALWPRGVRDLLRSIPASLWEARAREPIARLPFVSTID